MVANALTAQGAYFQQSYVVNTTLYPEQPGQGILAPGTTALGTDGSLWVFVRLAASQTITAGDFLYISSTNATDFVATALTQALGRSALGSEVGVAGCTVTSGSTSTASNFTGIWICRMGRLNANIATSVAGYSLLYTTSTAGRLNATASAGNNSLVSGVVGTATAASNLANVVLNFPVVSTNQ